MKTFMYIIGLLAIIGAAIAGILWYRNSNEVLMNTDEEQLVESPVIERVPTPTPESDVEQVVDPSAEHPSNIYAY